jgi:hypothetical protein
MAGGTSITALSPVETSIRLYGRISQQPACASISPWRQVADSFSSSTRMATESSAYWPRLAKGHIKKNKTGKYLFMVNSIL